MSPSLAILGMGLCLLLHAFFAGIETGVISIHRLRLRHFVRRGEAGARTLQGFLDRPDNLFGTTLVGTNLSLVILSVMSTGLLAHFAGPIGEPMAAVSVALIVLVFGEYLPKAWFQSRPLERCRRFVGLLRLAETVLRPLAWLVVGCSRLLVRGAVRSFAKPAPFVTRDDLKLLAREGERDGVLSSRERFMIHRVFELSSKCARDIMIPLEKIVSVETDMTVEQFREVVRASGRTRMPVYDRAQGAFVGVINVFFVLAGHVVEPGRRVAEFMRPAFFIPARMPVDDILPRMRRLRQPMCLVTEEKGPVIGLVTTEDILEEIVGQL